MSNPTQVPTTISNIGVAMFTIADQDAAIAYYTQTLGWELRADVPFGDEGGNRWVEVAPPGSAARLALNPPMGGGPGRRRDRRRDARRRGRVRARPGDRRRHHRRDDRRRGPGPADVLDRGPRRQPHLGRPVRLTRRRRARCIRTRRAPPRRRRSQRPDLAKELGVLVAERRLLLLAHLVLDVGDVLLLARDVLVVHSTSRRPSSVTAALS